MVGGTWREITPAEVPAWNVRLQSTAASYRQYPYWAEAHRPLKCEPIYLVHQRDGREDAFVCILRVRVLSRLVGLVHRGPVPLTESPIDPGMIQALATWASQRRYVFLQMSHPEESVLRTIEAAGPAERRIAYRRIRDPWRGLIVEHRGDADSLLASFQPVCRREIRAAERAGYKLEVSDSPDELSRRWQMLEALAERKGFDLSDKPLEVWLQIARNGAEYGLTRLYTAVLDDVPVATAFFVRSADLAEYTLGALDVPALADRASPTALLQFRAMVDSFAAGCRSFDLGGPGDGARNRVGEFKRKFRPEPWESRQPVILILDRRLYGLWRRVVLDFAVPAWAYSLRRYRRARDRFRGQR